MPKGTAGLRCLKSSSLDQPLLYSEVFSPQNLVFAKATFIKQFSLVFLRISESPKGLAVQLMNLKYY